MSPAAEAADLAVWDKVAGCESTGNWSINTGNGFYGGLQFSASTWQEFGGHAYAPNAHQATKAQQIAVAEKVLKVQGPSAWPGCSGKAGLVQGGPAPRLNATSVSGLDVKAQQAVPAQLAGQLSSGAVKVAVPVDGEPVVSAVYGKEGSWSGGHHTGVDYAVPTGTPVHAVGPGTVVAAGDQGAYGTAVTIQQADGRFTLSAHLSVAGVVVGQRVESGQQIGLSGSTGNSTGPHLHFEVRASNSYGADIDPVAYLGTLAAR